ncbi:MAG: hypothetical protein HN526_05355 [Gammaproteobacteria bacterium]|nr:hypothetical protein [Gammaproteobacteria bacterium]MDG1232461.1 hypothetical protein [Pseudomonadales bacterium]
MKYILWLVGIVLGLALIIGGLQVVASERVEVVQLHTITEAGEEVVTRLWVVDYNGHAYLRGDNDSEWFKRLQSSRKFTLIRGEQTGDFTHRVKNENIDTINQLMRKKYTWGDRVIEMAIGGRAESNAIELTPEKS